MRGIFFDKDDWARWNSCEAADSSKIERDVTVEFTEAEWSSIERAGRVILDWDYREAVLEEVNENNDYIERSLMRSLKLAALEEERNASAHIRRLANELIQRLQSDDLWGHYFHAHLMHSGDANECIRILGKLQRTLTSLELGPPPIKRRGRPTNVELDSFVSGLIQIYADAGGEFPNRSGLVAAEKDDIDLPVVGFVQAIGRTMYHEQLCLKEQARYRVLKALKHRNRTNQLIRNSK